MAATPTLICPKCRGEMRSYERNGIPVDQCEECRGIFLDRGELERLLNAESGSPRNDHERDDPSERHHPDEHRGTKGTGPVAYSRACSAEETRSESIHSPRGMK
jgi:Zn-finger nucleic acid-binding protein